MTTITINYPRARMAIKARPKQKQFILIVDDWRLTTVCKKYIMRIEKHEKLDEAGGSSLPKIL